MSEIDITYNLFSFVSTLSGVKRFSNLKQMHEETVLEHTGMCAIFALWIGQRLVSLGAIKTDDVRAAVYKATIHDWDEAITGDVLRPTKYYSDTMTREMKSLSEYGMARIVAKLNIHSVFNWYKDAKDKTTIEGFIVSLADFMCAVHRVWEEVMVSHNHHLVVCAPYMLTVCDGLLKTLKHEPIISSEGRKFLTTLLEDMKRTLEAVDGVTRVFRDIGSDEE